MMRVYLVLLISTYQKNDRFGPYQNDIVENYCKYSSCKCEWHSNAIWWHSLKPLVDDEHQQPAMTYFAFGNNSLPILLPFYCQSCIILRWIKLKL